MATLCLASAPLTFAQSPVHVALKASCAVVSPSDGFFTLGQIADLSGGDLKIRTRMAAVPVGRIPLNGDTRRLGWGDVALKLRQAGFRPDKDTVAEGAAQTCVSVETSPAPGGPLAPDNGGDGMEASSPGAAALVHRGDAVTILVQSGALTVTARGVAREDGAAGAAVHVHREGVMTDISVTVLDAQTVQLEL